MIITIQRTLHRLFLVSVWIKGLAGLLETVGGFLFFFVGQRRLEALVIFLTAPELSEDPNDWIATHLSRAVKKLSPDTKLFASAYLIIHGVIKLFLVAGLLQGRLWAYPVSLWFLAVFIAYQCYRFAHTQSIWLVLLSVFDLVVAFLIWREYRGLQDRRRLTNLDPPTSGIGF